jgi:choline dehydrogenase-like flavoprotein
VPLHILLGTRGGRGVVCVQCVSQRHSLLIKHHIVGGYGAGACSENLAVIQDVTVSKVLIEGFTAVGVEYLQGNSTEPEILLAANEVILSAGVFGSSKILMVRPFIRSPRICYQQRCICFVC